MARIRTIKPEFPQSETTGRLSRDARLLFVQLWTICDDDGRARAASRMLASLLYPYDDDAPALIDGWLNELDREGCIRRYVVDGDAYLEIVKWLKHQKIDRPSKSRIPPFDESSRIVANNREGASTDLGPSTLDLGPRTGGAVAPLGRERRENGSAEYAFEGRVIRLEQKQFDLWRKAYQAIPDMTAALQRADDYYFEHPLDDGKWFFKVSRWLDKENTDALRGKATEDQAYRGVM